MFADNHAAAAAGKSGKQKLAIRTVIFAAAIAAVFARADCARALTESQFIEKVLAQDELLEEAQIGVDIKQLELTASRENYQNWKTVLSGGAGYSYRDLNRQTASNSEYTKKTVSHPQSIGVDFEKKFLSNPSSITATIRRGKTRNLIERYKKHIPENDNPVYEEQYATTQRIRYKYPLLKHDGNAESLKTYRRNILDLQSQQLLFFEIKEDFLEDRLQDFLEWVLLHGRAQINREFLQKYRQLQPANAAEKALLESAVLRVQKYYDEDTADLRAIRQKLATLLDDPRILSQTPRFNFEKRAQLLGGNLEEYLREHSRDLARMDIAIALKEIDAAYYKNRLLPSLDFSVTAEYTGDSGNTRTNPSFNDDRDNYFVLLEFSYPLGGAVTDRTHVQLAQLADRKLKIADREQLQDLTADAQLLAAKLAAREPRPPHAVNAAAKSARIEDANRRAGRASLRDLLQALRDWREAKIGRIEDMTDYQTDRIAYDNLLDRMLAQ